MDSGRLARLTNPAISPGPEPGLGVLAHPNIHFIYESLEHVEGTNLQIQNSRISMTQDNNRISKRNPSESLGLRIGHVAETRGLEPDK